MTGRSLVVGPDGVVDQELGEAPELAVTALDPAAIEAARATNPSLVNRRYSVMPGAPVISPRERR